MSKLIHNKKSLSRTKKALSATKPRNRTSDGCPSRDNRRLTWHRVSPGLFDRFLIDVDRKYRAAAASHNRRDIFTTCVTSLSLFLLCLGKPIPQWVIPRSCNEPLAKFLRKHLSLPLLHREDFLLDQRKWMRARAAQTKRIILHSLAVN